MKIKTKEELMEMTSREIAQDAKLIIATNDYDTAKALLAGHIEVMNFKAEEVTKRLNKEFGVHRGAPKIRKLTDFLKYR